MLMKLWPGYWENQLEMINISLYLDNGKAVVMVNLRDWKVKRFSSNKSWKNIGCLVPDPDFLLRG